MGTYRKSAARSKRTAKRREMAGMFFKWLLRFYYKHSPKCHCGWAMKPFVKYTDGHQWKCIWKDCGWEAFEDSNGDIGFIEINK